MSSGRPGSHPAALLCAGVLILLGLINPADASHRPVPLRVEAGVLVNARAQYYFVVPEGWTLDGKSDYRHVVLLHSVSGASFTVTFKRAPEFDLGTEYQYLINALTLSGVKSVRRGREGLAIDGRPAMNLTFELPRAGSPPDLISQWLARDGEVSFEMMASIPQTQFGARTTEVGQMMSSFKWGKRDGQS